MQSTGDYLAYIDSDDWWEPDYLEKLVSFLEENDLDLALTGSLKYIEETGEFILYSPNINENLVLTQSQFAKNYEKYHIFPAALWGSVMKLNIYKSINGGEILSKVKTMPGDTVLMLEYIKMCKKIGIRNDKLYNYRIRKTSVTFEYNPERLPSALGYRDVVINFFEKNNAFDDFHQEWVKKMFLYYLYVAMSTLKNSTSLPSFKIREGLNILKHDVVKHTLLTHSASRNKTVFSMSVKELLSENVTKLENSEEREQMKEFLAMIAPDCGKFFDYNHLDLYVDNSELWNALLDDNVMEFVKVLLGLISRKSVNDIDVAEIVFYAMPENTAISDIFNKDFFDLYSDVCILVLNNKNTKALSEMTEILFSGNELNCPEDFLNVYIKLAALENHVEAFLFGNIQKAYLYIDEKRCDEAKSIVNDLIEMGAGESEDVIELQKLLTNQL